MALVASLSLVLMSGCPERNHIANFKAADDAAIQDSPRPPPKIILLIGDGMGRGQLDAASYFKYGALEGLNLQSLPVQGATTTSSPSGITDSAAAATAMATGSFTLNGRVGIDIDGNKVQNLVELAKSYGVATGLVTTTRIAHATPASFATHVNSRGQYEDIALQLAQLRPRVMLGGGRNHFESRADDQNLTEMLADAGYQVVSNATQLAALAPNENGPLLGLFAPSDLPYVVDRVEDEDDDTPTLSNMALAALNRLDQDPEGFFLMVEGGRIDHAGHAGRVDAILGETLAFDDAVRAVRTWAGDREDVTILVTADHETGGLQVNGPTEAGAPPNTSWRWGNHTNTTIRTFGSGPGTEVFDGATRDHRWVHAALSGLIKGEKVRPPTVILTNGFLEDLTGPTVSQARENPDDPATRLTRLTLAYNEEGLGIGLEGLFRWDQGAIVVLLDVDYGLATGLRSLATVSDLNDGTNSFLSRVNVPAPADNGFGADMVFLSQRGLSSVYSSNNAGLRGLRPPYGEPNDLKSIVSASNFSDNARSAGEKTLVDSSRGLELFIRWQHLYPGQSAPPPDTQIAAFAVQVNEDGSVTNQSLPPWIDEAATIAPAPQIIRVSEP